MDGHQIGCAVVGYGYWGPNLARNLQHVPGAELAYICDQHPASLAKAARVHPYVRLVTDLQTVLDSPEVQAVVLATPIATHAPLGLAVLESGKHLFVEKPLAASAQASADLVALAERKGLVLMTGHTFLYSPGVRKLKELLRSGAIGEPVHVTCSRLNLGLFQPDSNVIWDLMPHDLAILSYLLGGLTPVEVEASGAAHVMDAVQDTVTAFLHYPGGITAEVRASWIYPQKIREVTVVGTRKMIVFDDTQTLDKVRVIDRSMELTQPFSNLGEFQMSYKYGDTHIPLLENTEPLFGEMSDFVRCVRSGDRPVSDGRLGLEVVELLERIDSALRRRRPVVAAPVALRA